MCQLAEEEMNNLQMGQAKKNQFFQIMQETLAEKYERLQQEEREKATAEQKAFAELERQATRGKEWKDARQALDDRKEEIFNRMKEEKEAEIRKQQEIEALVADLRLQEQREAEREDRRRSEAKVVQQKAEMRRFEQEDQQRKQQRLDEEKRREKEWKDQMVREFAQTERLDQMNSQKRRLREAQHRRDIDALWAEKQARLEAERKAVEAEWQQAAAEKQFAEEVVQAEKRRLLEQHLPFIQEHCAPELWEEARRLAGESQRQ
jgi:hypothetical protein